MDDNGSVSERTANGGGTVSFLREISLGNVLIFAGMVGTGMLGIYTVGGNVQKVQDAVEAVNTAVVHETQMRTQAEAELQRQFTTSERERTEQIAALQRQETSDVANIAGNLRDLKTDMRALLQSSVPNTARNRN